MFLVGDNDNYVSISWQSHWIKRVMKSTPAAKIFAMVDTLEAHTFYRKCLLKLLPTEDNQKNFPIICKTHNETLHDTTHLSTQILQTDYS